jgi:hypothetical protein
MAFNPRWTASSKRAGSRLRLAMAGLAAMLWAFPAQAGPALIIEDGVGKVTVDGGKMFFVMGSAYDPDDKYPDDEPDLESVRDTSVYDDRGTFLAVVETFEKQCRSEPYPMNVDFDKFKKLKADWLKKRATATNYKKATREFKSNHDLDGRSYCGEVNPYVMDLKIFKHLPDDEWSKYETEAPAWMRRLAENPV